MDAKTYSLYKTLSKSKCMYQKMQTLHVSNIVDFIKTYYVCLCDQTVDDYRRSFDYRHGSWYTRIIHLKVYYNCILNTVDIELVSKIVDHGFVDTSLPVIQNTSYSPKQILMKNMLHTLLLKHVREEKQEHIHSILKHIYSNINQYHTNYKMLIYSIGSQHHLPCCINKIILSFLID